MAFCGHMNASGRLMLTDEIYSGRVRIHRQDSFSSSECDSAKSLSLGQEQQLLNTGSTSSRTYIIDEQQKVSPNSTSEESSPPPRNDSRSNSENSLYSWNECQSNVVPSLALSSKSSSYRYQQQIMKLDREPEEAYKEWYAAKEMERQHKQKYEKVKQQQERQLLEERKRIAQQSYENWLQEKARLANKQRVEHHLQTAAIQAVCSSNSDSTTSSSSSKSLRNLPPEEIRKVVAEWWLKKQQQKQRQREEKERAQIIKSLKEQRRKKLAERAWKKWISKAADKPKPVPLNQGMDSLRGTMSQLYINPKPWQGIAFAQAQKY